MALLLQLIRTLQSFAGTYVLKISWIVFQCRNLCCSSVQLYLDAIANRPATGAGSAPAC